MTWRWLATLLVLQLLAACAGGQQQAPRDLVLRFTIGAKTPITHFDLMGARPISFTVKEEELSCGGSAGFSQFVPEAPVEIRDERGTLLGQTVLGRGRVRLTSPDPEGRKRYDACTFEQSIPLEGPARIYVIHIAGERFVRREHISTLLRSNGAISYFTN